VISGYDGVEATRTKRGVVVDEKGREVRRGDNKE